MSRILIAISSPYAAQRVVDSVGDLAKRLNAEVLVVHVSRPSGGQMREQEQAEIRLEFARLKQEHMDFDAAINAMIAVGCDALQIQRMKKKKLSLKDRLANLEDKIIPDIIA